MKKNIFFPILALGVVVIVLFLSPFILSWISKTIVFFVDNRQTRIQWMNNQEEISSLPSLQFFIPNDIEEQIVENSFYNSVSIEGEWYWVEDDLAVWQPIEPLPAGQMVEFGFVPSQTESNKIKKSAWQTTVRNPLIIYLQNVESGRALFSLSPEQPDLINQITPTEGMIVDFSVSSNGEQIIFSQENSQSGVDLWLTDRKGEEISMVLDCGEDRCSSLDWNPIRDEIAFTIEKRITGTSQIRWDLPRPYLLNLVTGDSHSFFTDPSNVAYDPVWSSNGQWISLWNGENQGIEIVHSTSKESIYIEKMSDDTGCWSPEERYFYYSKVQEEGLPIVSIIYQVEIFTLQENPFPGSDLFDLGYNYYYPECHPLGDGMTVVVQVDPIIPYRELWWIKADQSYEKIYSDLTKMVTQFKWSPNGKQGIFLRDTLAGLVDGSEIVLWQVEEPEKPITFQDYVYQIEWLP